MILSAALHSFAHYELYWYPLLSLILIIAIVFTVEFVNRLTKDETCHDVNHVNVVASTNYIASPSVAYRAPIDQSMILLNTQSTILKISDNSNESNVSSVVSSPTDSSCDDNPVTNQVDQNITSEIDITATTSTLKTFSNNTICENPIDHKKGCKNSSTISTKYTTKTNTPYMNRTRKWNTFSTVGSIYSGSSDMTMTTTSVGSDDESVCRGTSPQNHLKFSKKCGITWKESMGKSTRTSTLIRRRSIRRRSLRQHSIWGQPMHY